MNVKVSVIIPAYNCEKTVERTLQSVQKQTFSEIEIIVVNDGSTDETGKIVEEIAKQDNRIIYINKQNSGVSVARNTGILFAKGEYIAFVDADDILLEDAIDELYNAVKYEDIDIVISGMYIRMRNRRGKERGTYYKYENVSYISNQEIWAHFNDLMNCNCLNSPCARLYRKEIIDNNAIIMDHSLEMGEDFQFNLSFLEYANSMKLIDGIVYEYYTYNSYLSRKQTEDLFLKRKKSVLLLDKHLKKHSLNRNIVYYLFLKLLIAQAMQEIKNKKKIKERLQIINRLKKQDEIKMSSMNYSPEGLLGMLLYIVIKINSDILIDVFARFCNKINIVLQKKYKRISV